MLAELVETLDQVEPRFLEIARAYRTWALAHPNLYRLVNSRPLPRAALPVGLEETGALPLVRACGGDRDLARAAWRRSTGSSALTSPSVSRRTPTSQRPTPPPLALSTARGRRAADSTAAA